MSNNEDKINEQYIQAILNLYKKIPSEETKKKLNFRTGLLKTLRNDLATGKINEETFIKAEKELTCAMENDDMMNTEGNTNENSQDVDRKIIQFEGKREKDDAVVAFRKKLNVQVQENKRDELITDDVIKITNEHNEQLRHNEHIRRINRNNRSFGRRNGKKPRSSRGER